MHDYGERINRLHDYTDSPSMIAGSITLGVEDRHGRDKPFMGMVNMLDSPHPVLRQGGASQSGHAVVIVLVSSQYRAAEGVRWYLEPFRPGRESNESRMVPLLCPSYPPPTPPPTKWSCQSCHQPRPRNKSVSSNAWPSI